MRDRGGGYGRPARAEDSGTVSPLAADGAVNLTEKGVGRHRAQPECAAKVSLERLLLVSRPMGLLAMESLALCKFETLFLFLF